MIAATDQAPATTEWLDRFHSGDRETLEACYTDYFAAVSRASAGLVRGPDHETVIHEVFFRLFTNPAFRAAFQGGSLGAWLSTVARNLARDHLRRQGREATVSLEDAGPLVEPASERFEEAAEARLLIERFRREKLPAKWDAVFVARFLEQRDQRDAAATLGLPRTTLAYQELRIRRLLRRFLLREAP